MEPSRPCWKNLAYSGSRQVAANHYIQHLPWDLCGPAQA